MKATWQQLIYGKLVQSTDGPIIQGKDHEITGCSTKLPHEIQVHCVPISVGLGTSDLSNWSSVIWNQYGGGITVQTVFERDETWIVAGRLRGRSEMGEGKSGRLYTQGHYVAIQAKEYSSPTALGLLQTLDATPMTEKNLELPTLEIPAINLSLPTDWIEQIAPIITVLFSELPLAIKTTKMSLEEMATLFQLVQAVLPKALAWRLSYRIGSAEAQEGDVILNCSQKVLGGPRMIGFSSAHPEQNEAKLRDISSATKHPLEAKSLIGKRYLQYMKEHLSHCTNISDIQQKLQTDFPHLNQWDYYPPKDSFSVAAAAFLLDIFEEDALSQLSLALKNNADFPSLSIFNIRKKEALSILLPHIWDYPDFTMETLHQWPDSWKELGKETALPALFFSELPLSEENVLQLPETLPEQFTKRIKANISKQFALIDTKSRQKFFLTILKTLDRQPNWIQRWVKNKEADIFWHTLDMKNPKPFFSTQLPSLQWFGSLVQDNPNAIKKDHLLFIKHKLGTPKAKEYFVRQLFPVFPLLALSFASVIPEDISLKKQLAAHNIIKWKALSQTAQHILEAPFEQDSTLSRHILLTYSAFASPLEKEDIEERISPYLPDLFSMLFFNSPSSFDSHDDDEFVVKLFLQLYRNVPDFGKNLFTEIPAWDEVLAKKAKSFLFTALQHEHFQPKCIYSSILHDLIRREPFHEDRGFVEDILIWWLSDLPLQEYIKHLCTDGHICLVYLKTEPPFFSPTAQLILEILQWPLTERLLWKARLRENGWNQQPDWRIISKRRIPPVPIIRKISKTELEVFSSLPANRLIYYMNEGFLLPDSLLQTISDADIKALVADDFLPLLWLTTHFSYPLFQKRLLNEGLDRLNGRERKQLELDCADTPIFSDFTKKWNGYLEKFGLKKKVINIPTTIPEKLILTEILFTILDSIHDKEKKAALFQAAKERSQIE